MAKKKSFNEGGSGLVVMGNFEIPPKGGPNWRPTKPPPLIPRRPRRCPYAPER